MKRSSLARVGAVSHVSCIDRRVISQPADDAARASHPQLIGYGLSRLESLCALFAAKPVRVMARCGAQTSEVFLELEGNVQIQYFGSLGASHDEQSLWVEGPRGSLRAEGAFLWWRKRGWPKFLPWRLRLSSRAENGKYTTGSAQSSSLLAAILHANEQGKVVELAP